MAVNGRCGWAIRLMHIFTPWTSLGNMIENHSSDVVRSVCVLLPGLKTKWHLSITEEFCGITGSRLIIGLLKTEENNFGTLLTAYNALVWTGLYMRSDCFMATVFQFSKSTVSQARLMRPVSNNVQWSKTISTALMTLLWVSRALITAAKLNPAGGQRNRPQSKKKIKTDGMGRVYVHL